MDPVSVFLLTIAGIFLVGVLGERVFERTQVPDAVWLVSMGVVLGPVAGLLRQDQLREIAPFFASLTLIVILFDGGRRLQVGSLGRAALPATLLALVAFVCSCAVVALLAQLAAAVGWLPGPWTLQHSLLLGAILGGSSSVVIMPSMARARVEPRTADLVGLESAITDVLCVVGAGTMVQLIGGSPGAGDPLGVVASTFGIGLGLGAAAGVAWVLFLRLLRRSAHGFPLTLSALLILYVVVDRSGGSPALAVLTFAVLVGNAEWILARAGYAGPAMDDGPDFHGQLVFLVKSFFFTFIGAMLGPPIGLAVLGVAIGLALLPARLPAARLVGGMLRLPPAERGIVGVALPRGLAAGVLATLPAAAGVPGTESLPAVVFPAVVTTILVFSIGFPMVRRRAAPASAPAAGDAAGPAEGATAGAPAGPAPEPGPGPAGAGNTDG